jgi:hypothetical protein
MLCTSRCDRARWYKTNPFWDSKPELFSDIACLRIPYQPCIVLYTDKSDVWNRLYHVMEKAITWHTFKTSQNGDMQWIWSGGWEWWAVSDVIGRWNVLYFIWYEVWNRLYHVIRWIWSGGSRRGYLNKFSRIELCMVDKGFGGRQYQKTTVASYPKRD